MGEINCRSGDQGSGIAHASPSIPYKSDNWRQPTTLNELRPNRVGYGSLPSSSSAKLAWTKKEEREGEDVDLLSWSSSVPSRRPTRQLRRIARSSPETTPVVVEVDPGPVGGAVRRVWEGGSEEEEGIEAMGSSILEEREDEEFEGRRG